MDPSSFSYLIFFIIFLLVAAIFSGAEAAFFNINKSQIAEFGRSERLAERQAAFIFQQPRKLYICLVLLKTAFMFMAVYVALDWYSLIRNIWLLPVLLLAAFIIILVVELLAKIISPANSRQVVIALAIPVSLFYYVTYPLIVVVDYIIGIVGKPFGLNKTKFSLSEDELRSIVNVSDSHMGLEQDEREMIHGIFEMSDTTAKEIMIPRIDMVCVEEKTSVTQLLRILKDKRHSRIPIYKDTIDNVVGILHVKDLLPLIRKRNTSDFNLLSVANPPYFVPDQKTINTLLREFRTERIHMAIVVDEYGGTAGLVTLEDVIEEIVGEIQDEYDREAPMISRIDDNVFLVTGGILLEELNQELEFDLPTEEGAETLAGFLLGRFGTVPKTKSQISWNGYDFVVERVYRRRIERVRVIKREKKESEEQKPGETPQE